MLINCVAYQEGKKLKDISVEEINHYLTMSGCFVWVAVQDAKLSELEKMRDQFDFHTLALEDAWHSHQRPKIEEYGDSIFAVMHLTEMTGDHLTNGEVHVFVGINYVLSSAIAVASDFWRCGIASSVNRICSVRAQASCSMR